MLNREDRLTLIEIENLARRLELQAYGLRCAVEYCKRNETLKGLDDMVAYSFSAQQHTPQYGGSGGLPAGKYKGVIAHSAPGDVEKNGQVVGGYIAFELTPIEGPLAGQKHTDRINVHNVNPKVVEIAMKQLSAYCHVLGVFNMQDTAQLHNIPFLFEIGPQKNDPNYTEVKAIWDINGNEPAKAGSGPQTSAQPQPQPQPTTAPAGGVQPQGGGWGGAQPDPNAGQPQAQAWGGAQPQPQPNAGQPQGGNAGWGGAPAGQPQPQPQAQGGWAQSGGGGGAPGWGAR
jgi:hypothetical protein